MGNHGIKFGLPGQNLLTAEDKNIVWSSKYNSLKVVTKGTIDITTNGSGIGSGSIAHNLGFSPTFHVFRKGTADWRRNNKSEIDNSTYANAYFPNPGNENNWLNFHATTQVNSDNTNLNFYIEAENNTTYTFTYFIFADLSVLSNNNSPFGQNNFGMKVAQPNKDAREQKDFQLGFTSKFRPLQYNHVKSQIVTMNLPLLFPSQYSDSQPEEAVYCEVTHGLGYPPFFLGFFKDSSAGNSLAETNEANQSPLIDLGLGGLIRCVDSWCDATRIRFSFWRKAYYEADDSWSASTLTVKCLIFNEDLTNFN